MAGPTQFGYQNAGFGGRAYGGTVEFTADYVLIGGGGGGASTGGEFNCRGAAGGGAGGYRTSVSGENMGGGASAESSLTFEDFP